MPDDLYIDGPHAIRPFALANVCETGEIHKHHYDHTTKVERGRVQVAFFEDGIQVFEGEYGEGETFECLAGRVHRIKALTPDTEYRCIFLHRDWDGNVIPDYIGNVHSHEGLQVEA